MENGQPNDDVQHLRAEDGTEFELMPGPIYSLDTAVGLRRIQVPNVHVSHSDSSLEQMSVSWSYALSEEGGGREDVGPELGAPEWGPASAQGSGEVVFWEAARTTWHSSNSLGEGAATRDLQEHGWHVLRNTGKLPRHGDKLSLSRNESESYTIILDGEPVSAVKFSLPDDCLGIVVKAHVQSIVTLVIPSYFLKNDLEIYELKVGGVPTQ